MKPRKGQEPYPVETSVKDIEKDFLSEKKFWAVERTGWVLMGMLVLAAFLGFTGPGLWSHKEIETPGQELKLKYDRLLRYRTGVSLDLSLKVPRDAGQRLASIALCQSYIEKVRIERITPPPEKTRSDGEMVWFIFPISGPGTLKVSFHLVPQKPGRLEGRIEKENGLFLRFVQFVFL